MSYRNIKVEFEFEGADYPGIAVPDGIEILVGQTKIDGFPEVFIFKGAQAPYPTIAAGGMASISRFASVTSGYYELTPEP